MSEKLCYIHFWNCSISFRIRRKKIRFRRRSLWYAFHINWLFSLQRDVFRLQNYTYSNFFHWSSIARYPFCDFLIECSTFQLTWGTWSPLVCKMATKICQTAKGLFYVFLLWLHSSHMKRVKKSKKLFILSLQIHPKYSITTK